MNFNNRPIPLLVAAMALVTSWGCDRQQQSPETPPAEPQQATGQQAREPASPRSITRLTGDTYRAQDARHFTVFLVTPEGIILADPLNSEFATWLKGELAARFDVPVRYVLYSHHHWDHASGGAVFADTATFVGHENMLEQLAVPPSAPLPPEAAGMDADEDGTLAASEAQGSFRERFRYYDADGDGALTGPEIERGPVADVRRPDVTYSSKEIVSLGGHTAELTSTGPITHTNDMSVIRFPDQGVVFVVDFINIRMLPYRTLGSGLLDEWLAAIRAVEEMEFEIVAPGHGSVGARQDVAAFRQYLEDLRAAVSDGIDSGASVERLQETIALDRYSDWSMYREWRPENVAGMYDMLTAE